MNKEPRLELQRVMLSEAAEIIASRERCLIIHGTSDIDAAGDEVEMCVRDLLRNRLGQNYYVGHGHIVDSEWQVSPQLDIIVADASVIPSLFKSENGTEYFPYESIYAIGEIKSTYRKSKKYIQSFSSCLQKIDLLKREDAPPNYIRTHSGGFTLDEGLVAHNRHGKQNNLFKFMVFVDAGDFDEKDAGDIYDATQTRFLPNAVCLINKGLIVNCQIDDCDHSKSEGQNISIALDPSRVASKVGRKFSWALYSNGTEEVRALSWGVLYALIVQHLMNATLKPVSPLQYLQRLATSPIYRLLTDPKD